MREWQEMVNGEIGAVGRRERVARRDRVRIVGWLEPGARTNLRVELRLELLLGEVLQLVRKREGLLFEMVLACCAHF